MALKLALENSTVGYPFPAAYARISLFTGDKGSIVYRVNIWANEDARKANAQPVFETTFHAEISTTVAVLESLYNHLKTQEMFINAVDV